MKVRNAEAVKAALLKQKVVKLHGLSVGLASAGAFLLSESKKIVPVDIGNLKASGYVRMEGKDTTKAKCLIGYTAAYAIFVHENLDALHGAAGRAVESTELAAA